MHEVRQEGRTGDRGDKDVKKFGAGLSDAQVQLARRFAAAGLTSYSQAIKAFQRRDDEQIAAWKSQLPKR